jgi:hypothetical protein
MFKPNARCIEDLTLSMEFILSKEQSGLSCGWVSAASGLSVNRERQGSVDLYIVRQTSALKTAAVSHLLPPFSLNLVSLYDCPRRTFASGDSSLAVTPNPTVVELKDQINTTTLVSVHTSSGVGEVTSGRNPGSTRLRDPLKRFVHLMSPEVSAT